MKLYSGDTYWDKTMKVKRSFPQVKIDISTEILVIGGGMSGNLVAYLLAKNGHGVVLVDKSKLGNGSSKANTGLLQYSSDIMISELRNEIGEKNAVLFYKMCLGAMISLRKLSKELNSQTNYKSRESIYYASNNGDAKKLKIEYKLLKKYSFPVEFIDKKTLKESYNINKPCALKTWYDAEVNPYKFIQALINKNIQMGVKYFENTSINLDNIKNNKAYTENSSHIAFKSIIMATGYSKLYGVIKDKARIDRTYAFSARTDKSRPWKDNVMFWETKIPYLYFRTAENNRIIAGGMDEKINQIEENQDIIYEKTETIKEEIETFFPDLNLNIDYRWNALFGSSKDGLPFIGRDPIHRNKYYLLGYEGNGTCYSMAGAEILTDLI